MKVILLFKMEQILHYRKRNFFCKSSKSREKENWNILCDEKWQRNVFSKSWKLSRQSQAWFRPINDVRPTNSILFQRPMHYDARKSMRTERQEKIESLHLDLISIYLWLDFLWQLSFKLAATACIQWLVKIPLKKYMKIHFFSSRKKTKREFIEI